MNLRRTMEDLVATGGQHSSQVTVPPETVAGARLALERMLSMP